MQDATDATLEQARDAAASGDWPDAYERLIACGRDDPAGRSRPRSPRWGCVCGGSSRCDHRRLGAALQSQRPGRGSSGRRGCGSSCGHAPAIRYGSDGACPRMALAGGATARWCSGGYARPCVARRGAQLRTTVVRRLRQRPAMGSTSHRNGHGLRARCRGHWQDRGSTKSDPPGRRLAGPRAAQRSRGGCGHR